MTYLPEIRDTPVLRTDFTDQVAWEAICNEVQRLSSEGHRAYVELIDDRAFDSFSVQQIVSAVPVGYSQTFIIVVDKVAVESPHHPVLIVELDEKPGAYFRAVPATVRSIENNLSIANMDFEEFADAVDSSGVFRGF